MRILFLLLFIPFFLSAQDSYHTTLQNQLQSQYGLPAGAWIFHNTEQANLNSDFSYGSLQSTDESASGQDFSQYVSLDIDFMAGQPWDSGYGLNSVNPVSEGDRCLLVIWMQEAAGPGKVSLSVQDATTFASEFFLEVPISSGWKQYIIPFEASADYEAGNLRASLSLNWQDQIVEIAGLNILNYGTSVNLEDLPLNLNNEFYDGHETNAPWRIEAEQRIEQIRKADLNIQVVDENNMPVPDAQVQVNMLDHAFGFGTAVAAHNFAGNSQQNNTYEDRLLDLDGNGHRFNCAVFENATKWVAWEQNWWGVSQEDKANTVQWLVDNDFKVRGHTLIWPSWTNLPSDLEDNQGDPDYLVGRVMDHIEAILTYPGLEGQFSDWDVLNEISVLNDLADALAGTPGYPTGREIYAEIFDKFWENNPDGTAYLNDYTTFGKGSSQTSYDNLKTYAQEILDAGQTIDGIGFQAHIATYPTGITRVYDILEDFHATFGTKAKITEFDMDVLMDEELSAQYLNDFYTICFSHPSVDAILMWGFWDGAHWFDNAPIYRDDWSLKPSGQAFFDLVFDEWWTEEQGQTDINGNYDLRGFKGTYEITVDCNGQTLTETVEVLEDTDLVLNCADALSVNDLVGSITMEVFPNPASDLVTVNWEDGRPANLRLIDATGKVVLETGTVNSPVELNLDFPVGVYELVWINGNTTVSKKVIIK